MISFTDLCEQLTSKQYYTWFYFYKSLLSKLTKEELSLVAVEELGDTTKTDIVCIFYPRSNYNERKLTQEEFRLALQIAIDKEDWEEVKRLQERNK